MYNFNIYILLKISNLIINGILLILLLRITTILRNWFFILSTILLLLPFFIWWYFLLGSLNRRRSYALLLAQSEFTISVIWISLSYFSTILSQNVIFNFTILRIRLYGMLRYKWVLSIWSYLVCETIGFLLDIPAKFKCILFSSMSFTYFKLKKKLCTSKSTDWRLFLSIKLN